MRLFAFDFETDTIAPARQVPPAVCMSFATDLTPSGSGVVLAAEGVERLFYELRNADRIIGANLDFDVMVSVREAGAAHWREMLHLWVQAYEAGRCADVLIRQKLLELAAGRFALHEVRPGVWIKHKYNLGDVARRVSGLELDKQTFWRTHYAALRGVPVHLWPREAYDYALEDATGALQVFGDQEIDRRTNERIRRNFPGLDPLADEINQTIAALPLGAVSAYGLRTNRKAVDGLQESVEGLLLGVRNDLLAAGLVRREDTRSADGVKAYCAARGIAPNAASFRASGDPHLEALTHWSRYLAEVREATEQARPVHPDWLKYADALAAVGLVRTEYSRNTKIAAQLCAAAYAKLGKSPPVTDGGGVALDSDACEKSEEPLLQSYAEYSSLAKTLSNDLVFLRNATELPIHPGFDELKETGRTSAFKPNSQNIRRLPGIRECFAPRDGHVFVDADFRMLELHTLAQICYWWLGYSTLGDALNAGDDPHLRIAATILGKSYAECVALRAAGDSEVDNARVAGKGVNFGAAGGLGPDTFSRYAWKAYGLRKTVEECRVLIKQYKDTWHEIPAYFARINALESSPGSGSYNVVQPWSMRLRADTTFCSACNSPFQGLGSEVAKVALWLVFKAMHGESELGTADPLYGCRQSNFVHDSNMLEVPIERIDEAAPRLVQLMDRAGQIVLPTVPVKTDFLVTRHWSKKAKLERDAFGKIVPWDVNVACAKALRDALQKGDAHDKHTGYEWLVKKEWPRTVAREVIGEHFGAPNIVRVAA